MTIDIIAMERIERMEREVAERRAHVMFAIGAMVGLMFRDDSSHLRETLVVISTDLAKTFDLETMLGEIINRAAEKKPGTR